MFVLFSISVRFYSSIYFIRFSMNIYSNFWDVIDRFLLSYHRVIRFSFSITSLEFGCGNLPLVGSSGLEPPTSRLSGARSNHLSYEPIQFFRCISSTLALRLFAVGGDDGNRTHDPLLAGQVLSQLSYTPIL